nr:MAG TPA: hypothetical protein [Caudoviricetes sp.]
MTKFAKISLYILHKIYYVCWLNFIQYIQRNEPFLIIKFFFYSLFSNVKKRWDFVSPISRKHLFFLKF